ncbi:MAG: lipopolysaccharide biosynthesis protein [Solirubrobacteraceae bacterium]
MRDGERNSLRTLVRRGAVWSALDVVVNRTSGFLLGIVVARLLAPADFGIYAVALVIHAILINISDLGIGAAIIRDDQASVRRSGPTVTTIALVSSVSLGLLMVLFAPVLADLLGAPKATGAIRVMAITLPLAGITAVPSGLLRREFKLRTIFVADTANNAATAVAVIALALLGAGAMALAWSFVAGQLLTAIVLFAKSPAYYWPGWNRGEAGRILKFTLPLVGANVLAFTTQNVDYMVVGKLMGSVSLGLYVLAFNISGWPQNVMGFVIKSVSLPAFARLKEEGASMAPAFCGALKSVVRVTFPVCLLLGALAHPLVVTVYGSKWSLAAQALVGLVILGASRTLVELFSDYLTAIGHPKLVLAVQVVWLPALIGSMLVLVDQFGIAGAGAAQAAVCLLLVIPMLVFFVNRAGVPWLDVAKAMLPAFVWALATAALAWYVASLIDSPFLACLAGGSAGLLVYLAPYLPEVRRMVASRRKQRVAQPAVLVESAS